VPGKRRAKHAGARNFLITGKDQVSDCSFGHREDELQTMNTGLSTQDRRRGRSAREFRIWPIARDASFRRYDGGLS
jgi:hypothetical protein